MIYVHTPHTVDTVTVCVILRGQKI
jgi:hypothetical protein